MNLGRRIYWKDAFACNLIGYVLFIKKDEPDSHGNERIIKNCINKDNRTEEVTIT